METKANYVLIGSFTILVTVLLLGFALWAAKYSSDKTWQRYQVIFNEPVTGLTEGSSVQYNGISVGTVERLKLDVDDPRRVQALLKLEAVAPTRLVKAEEVPAPARRAAKAPAKKASAKKVPAKKVPAKKVPAKKRVGAQGPAAPREAPAKKGARKIVAGRPARPAAKAAAPKRRA